MFDRHPRAAAAVDLIVGPAPIVSRKVTGVLVALALCWGLNKLKFLVEDAQTELTDLEAKADELETRIRARLDELDQLDRLHAQKQHPAGKDYPAADDVDPLRRGEPTDAQAEATSS